MIISLLLMFVFILFPVLLVSAAGQQVPPAFVGGSGVLSLAGLDGVAGLIVENLDADLVQNGLSMADVRAEIEVLLYKYGVLKRDGKSFDPVLWVQVGTYKIGKVYAFTVRLEFLQYMRFARPMPKPSSRVFVPEKDLVATWSQMVLGAAPASDLSEIRRTLRDLTTKFITDFRTANDKQK
ncbi:MAG: hypothetical protein A3F90_20160 [Deltaproteobacteria bacterium RIFCSPLOWO2_12_FULL_60_19]|nr:MAG: hypothetical protein A3F90_20160 [Deltaproteobacteria bacterium RIFCSPLOWO2_12_FULL_60_19]